MPTTVPGNKNRGCPVGSQLFWGFFPAGHRLRLPSERLLFLVFGFLPSRYMLIGS